MGAPISLCNSALLRRLLVATLVVASLFQAAHAQGLVQQNAGESKAKATIRSVTADPVFGSDKENTQWRYIKEADESPKTDASPSWLESLKDIIEYVARVLRILVWVGGALLLAALVYLSYRYRHAWLGVTGRRSTPPDFMFGLDVRPESLPDDVVAAALLELSRGNAKRALSLLYRAALVSLIHQSQLDFHAGHTEDDCLRLARTAVDAGCSGYFAELLAAWKLTAYANETPPAPVLDALCHRWRVHFTPGASSR